MDISTKEIGIFKQIRLVLECQCTKCGKIVYLDESEFAASPLKCTHYERPGRWRYALPRRKIPEYTTWVQIRARCRKPNAPGYTSYGGRGIYVCERWEGKDGFKHFFADMGARPAGHSLDRIDNDGPYSPENCRWAKPTEQQRNRRNTRKICVGGVSKTVYQWAEDRGVPYVTVWARLKRGWNPEEAVNTPLATKTSVVAWQGRTMSLSEWSRTLGIKYMTLLGRYRRGIKPPDLFQKPDKRITVMFRGEVCSLLDISKATGICVGTIADRYYRQGLRGDDLGETVRR